MQIAIMGIEQQPRCGLYCCFQLQTVSGGLGSIRYPDIGLARIADAECASLNVRVFRIEARQVCSHRHTSQAPVRLDADLIVTDIFRPVSWLRGARFLRSRHAGIEATRIVRSDERRVGKECVSTCRYRWSQYI